jgi:DNA-binding Lrp family transcriptional regulator
LRLDDIDRRIVAVLTEDGRASFRQIGEWVGLSAPATKRRVDRLRERGVLRVAAVLDPAAIGRGTTAFVEVFCGNQIEADRIRIGLTGVDEVVGAWTVTGDADALVHLAVADTDHLEAALARIRALPFVEKTRSVVVLSQLVDRAPVVGGRGAAGSSVLPAP